MKKSSKLTKKRMMSDDVSFYLFMAPFVLLFFLFTVIPILASMVLSFFDYDMVSKPIWLGLDNYIRMFTSDELFFTVLGNSLKFGILVGPGGYLLAFLLAWMINEFPRAIRVLLTFIFYVPSLASNATYIFQIMFSGDSYAYINNLLISFGLVTEPIQWFQDTGYNFVLIVGIQLWMSMGVSFLANIAGLQNVNAELYEAGAIDGINNRFQEIWFMTLPQMKPQLLFGAVMQISSSFACGGVMATLCGNPSVDYATHTIINHISDYGGERYELGYACAISTVLLMAMLLVNKVINKVLVED